MYGLHAFFSNAFAGQGLAHVAAAAAAAPGGVTPTAPGPNDVFKQGGTCTFSWTPDPSGVWKQTDVELMTGDNFNMVFITTVASFDGTDASKGTFSYPCPEVTPNSAIYFYQFTSPAAPTDRFWTTRFTIADAQGNTVPPTNDTQPGGQKISWGTGKLVDPSKAVSAPSYLGIAPPAGGSATSSSALSTSASGSSSSSSSASASASSSSSSSTSSSASASESTSGSGAETTNAQSSTNFITVTHTSTPSSAPAAPTESTATNNGSGNGGSGNNNGGFAVRAGWGQAVLALGVAVAAFAVVA